MPFHHARLRRFYLHLAAALLAGLLPILLGLGIIYWQTQSGLHRDAQNRLDHARRMMDQTLDHAHRAADAVAEHAGQPCELVEQRLREQVATVPDVRTVNLARGRTIYCTSLYGSYQADSRIDDFIEGQLNLMPGNRVTPNHPLIAYRQPAGEYSVLVGIDGYYLRNILDMPGDGAPLHLVVGSRWMGPDGQVHEGLPAQAGQELSLSSTDYAYRLGTHLSGQNYWHHAWTYSSGSLLLLPLFSLGAGFGLFWLLGRAISPAQELARALQHQEFVPFLQLVVDGQERRCTGCEVLMRWQHPRQGMIPPDRFIPLAEDSGLVIPMTRALMTQVREHFAPLARQLPVGFHFGFNISASHCRDFDLVDDCRAFITAFDGHPVKLVLELTERELVVADDVTDRLFAELRALGVLVAIDDFGTGHSSLAYLQQFRVDFLKIDRSFVGMIGVDALSSHLVDNVIDLATRLELKMVAEGVENQAQVDYLAARQVHYLQGYFFGRPQPLEEFSRTLLDD
ncbi:EAL domain-containing protein [Zobellella sp. DQSA1]|uniref:EAL domain-containing protein n=1 Tax=Zobellella sp. DQSA1 TaxID=3342386 RepID=UPI0035C23767